MLLNFSAVFIFIIISIFFLLSLLFLNFLVTNKKKSKEKTEIFECGEPTIGDCKLKFNGHFYNVALLYILFDLEIALLVPVLIVYKDLIKNDGILGPFCALFFFFILLVIGFIYEWHEGNIIWLKDSNKNKLEDNK